MENLETQTNNNLPVEENEQEITKEEDFAELVESSFHKVQEGEVVTGMVVQVTAEHVMIDVGSKSEGQIPIEQFLDEKGSLTVSVGDEVQVFLEDTEESSGQVRISKSKADKIRIWDEIAEVCETEKTIMRQGDLAREGGAAGRHRRGRFSSRFSGRPETCPKL